jgi:tetratricopeptide (TPR) repeat protein
VRILMAELKAATRDTAGALDDLRTVLAEEPASYRALNAKADVQILQKNWKGAEETLRAMKKAYATDARIDQRMGTLFLAQRQYDKAVAAYEAALARVPGAIEPLTGLANVRVAQGKPELAVAKVEKTLEATPDNFLAQALLGRLEGLLKQHDKAEASFRKAVAINPRVPGTHVELANYLLERGKADAAVDALKEGLKGLPGDNALSFRLAEAYRMSGKVDDAIAAYDEMLKRDTGNDLAANNLASMLLDLKDDKASHERARTLAQRFERSVNPAYIDTLGWANFRLGDYTQAVLHLNKASEKAPQVAIFQFHLGMALHKRGDAAMARQHLQKAVESKAEIPGIDEAKKILAAG